MNDEDVQLMYEMNSGEIEIDENGDWVWRSAEDLDRDSFEWARFERAYWNAYPLDIHPELRARAELSEKDEVTEVNVFGPDGQQCVTLTLYDRERDTIHFEVVKCTRLERVRWGLEPDPYIQHNAAQYPDHCMPGESKLGVEESTPVSHIQEFYGEEFE